MEPDYTYLTNWAECDKATDDATFELETIEYRNKGFNIADKRADRSEDAATAALAKKDEEIATARYKAAQPGLSGQDKQDADDVVELLENQRKKILRDNRDHTGNARFNASVDAAQTAAQAALLRQVLTGIAARRAQLSA